MLANGLRGRPVGGEGLDPVDHGHHDQQGQDDAGHVHAARLRVAGFRDQCRTEQQQGQDDRHRDQQDGAPPEVFHQPAAGNRAEGGAAGEACGPDRHGQPAPVGLRKDVADQGQRGRHEHGAEEAKPGAAGDQPFGARRERRHGRNGGKARAADEEQPAPADPVAQAAHRDQQSGQDQGIGVDDPEQLDAGGGQAAWRWPAGRTSGRCCPRPRAGRGTSAGPAPPSHATVPGVPGGRPGCWWPAVIDGSAHGLNYTVWTVQLRNAGPDRHDGRHAQETRRPRGRPRCLRIPADRSR